MFVDTEGGALRKEELGIGKLAFGKTGWRSILKNIVPKKISKTKLKANRENLA
ncbi:MAG: hypothetical protein WC643_02015 [Parcubacteria group bacterium]